MPKYRIHALLGTDKIEHTIECKNLYDAENAAKELAEEHIEYWAEEEIEDATN